MREGGVEGLDWVEGVGWGGGEELEGGVDEELYTWVQVVNGIVGVKELVDYSEGEEGEEEEECHCGVSLISFGQWGRINAALTANC